MAFRATRSKVTRYLPFIIIGAVAFVTLTAGTILYRAKRVPVGTIPPTDLTGKTGEGRSVHVRGRLDAPVTIEEFGDLQCPPCAQLAGVLSQLERDYRSSVRVIFHHLPLAVHQHAREAAIATEAAGLQGKFWEMHDLLYRKQSDWSKAADVRSLLNAYATSLRLDIDRFKKDMESEQVKARVTADQERAASLGITTTPTVFINGRALPHGSVSLSGLRAAVDAALKPKRPPT